MDAMQASAREAEALLKTLQKRVQALEKAGPAAGGGRGGGGGGDGPALRAYQTEMLGKLRALRKALQEEGDLTSVKEERDAALAENAKLKKDLAKAQYRIMHLKRALVEADAEKSAA